MNELLVQTWAVIPAAAHGIAAVAVTVDAVLRKRQVSAVIGWIGLAWLAPGIGSILSSLKRLSAQVTGNPLLAGNRIEVLEDGDAAFPAMLAAIDSHPVGDPGQLYLRQTMRRARSSCNRFGALRSAGSRSAC